MSPTTVDVHQLDIVYTAGGQYMECVLHYKSNHTNSTTPFADSKDLAITFEGTMQTTLLACWYSDVVLLGYRAKRVNNGGGPQAIVPVPAGTVGTVTGTAGTPTTRQSALIEMDYYDTNGTPPNWRQGRIYLGGVPAGFWVDDVWVSGAVTIYGTLCSALQVPISSGPGTWTAAVWAKKSQVAWSGPAWELSGHMGHQKRRIKPGL